MPDTEGLDRYVFVDLETMGLDPKTDHVIEIGFKIIGAETLDIIDDFEVRIWDSPSFDERWETVIPYVKEMHQQSGLYVDGVAMPQGSETPKFALEAALAWLKGHGVENEPLCGSSVHFDRDMLTEQYPDIISLFSYRNIDVSTLKELCRRMNPGVYERIEEVCPPQKKHRVLADLDDTISEFRFYTQEFLIW